MKIPLIIVNFNQLTYLVNLINWWKFYTHNGPVFIIDNKSTYKPLLDFYNNNHFTNINIIRCQENNCGKNLRHFIDNHIKGIYDYYCISNPDIMPYPSVPENFLDIFQFCIDSLKFHHVGFALKINDLPDYIDNRKQIKKNESNMWFREQRFHYQGKQLLGYVAPLDLTFAMYTTKNTGWYYKMDREDWKNSFRLFEAFHFGWYISPKTTIEEHKQYFRTCLKKADVPHIKGVNNYKPNKIKL